MFSKTTFDAHIFRLAILAVTSGVVLSLGMTQAPGREVPKVRVQAPKIHVWTPSAQMPARKVQVQVQRPSAPGPISINRASGSQRKVGTSPQPSAIKAASTRPDSRSSSGASSKQANVQSKGIRPRTADAGGACTPASPCQLPGRLTGGPDGCVGCKPGQTYIMPGTNKDCPRGNCAFTYTGRNGNNSSGAGWLLSTPNSGSVAGTDNSRTSQNPNANTTNPNPNNELYVGAGGTKQWPGAEAPRGTGNPGQNSGLYVGTGGTKPWPGAEAPSAVNSGQNDNASAGGIRTSPEGEAPSARNPRQNNEQNSAGTTNPVSQPNETNQAGQIQDNQTNQSPINQGQINQATTGTAAPPANNPASDESYGPRQMADPMHDNYGDRLPICSPNPCVNPNGTIKANSRP